MESNPGDGEPVDFGVKPLVDLYLHQSAAVDSLRSPVGAVRARAPVTPSVPHQSGTAYTSAPSPVAALLTEGRDALTQGDWVGAKRALDTPKLVVSTTLKTVEWQN